MTDPSKIKNPLVAYMVSCDACLNDYSIYLRKLDAESKKLYCIYPTCNGNLTIEFKHGGSK